MLTIDTKIHDKWELFNSLYSAFHEKDGSKLSTVLRHKKYESDELGKTGEYTVYNIPRQFTQVITECLYDINKRIEAIENAK